MENSQEELLNNQKTILNNQEGLANNQKTILGNQEGLANNQKTILGNQDGLAKNQETIMHNQEVIVQNQASIISNQKQIVDNQVTLSALLHGQAHILNLLRKVAGQEESLETTTAFLEKLKNEAQESLNAKALNDPKSL